MTYFFQGSFLEVDVDRLQQNKKDIKTHNWEWSWSNNDENRAKNQVKCPKNQEINKSLAYYQK